MNATQRKALRDLANAAAQGHVTLPLDVAEALAASDRVRTAADLVDVGVYDAEVAMWAVHDVVITASDPAAAAAAQVRRMLDDERAARARHMASQLLDQAAESAAVSALHAVQGSAPTIVTSGLQPALQQVLGAVRTALPGLGGREPTRQAIFGSAKPVLEAFAALEAATARYQVLRSCQAGLVLLGYGPKPRVEVDTDGQRRQVNDTEGWCLLARDAFYGAWPADARGGSANWEPKPAPWAALDPVGAFVWQVAHEVPLWCPTVPQQNEAYLAVVAMLRGEYGAARAAASRRGGAVRSRTTAVTR